MDPHGGPFFLKGVAAVNRHGRVGASTGHPGAYARALENIHGTGDAGGFAKSALLRLRNWHVNTLGPWPDPSLEKAGLYVTALADFRGCGVPVIHMHGVRLPDVFDPGWTAACDRQAADVTGRWIGREDLVGYYTDDALGWGEVRNDRPSLLQVCLSLEPGFSAYHAAWEFVLASNGGDLGSLARAWSIDLPNREVIRQRTTHDRPLSTGVICGTTTGSPARWRTAISQRRRPRSGGTIPTISCWAAASITRPDRRCSPSACIRMWTRSRGIATGRSSPRWPSSTRTPRGCRWC